MMATIAEKRSTHIEMSVTGGRGAGGRPDVYEEASSSRMPKSISRIFFTTLGGRQAAGLYGPDVNREPDDPGAMAVGTGAVTVGDSDSLGVAIAAAASKSNPDTGRGCATEKMGRLSITEVVDVKAPTVGAVVDTGLPAETRDRPA